MRYYRAKNRAEALRLIKEYPHFLLLCGSTDITVNLKKKHPVEGLIDISKVEELRFIKKEDERVEIGALTTVSELLENEKIRHSVPLLHRASEQFASHQVRNMATLGGNIANASPASDFTTVLMALNATVTLGSLKGERTLPLEALLCGYKCTKLHHEMILSIHIPLGEHQWYYRKTGTRERLNIAKVSLAVVKRGHHYAFSGASLAPSAVRFKHLESVVNRGTYTEAEIKEALEKDISPSGSFRSTKAYRMRVVFNMVKEALATFQA